MHDSRRELGLVASRKQNRCPASIRGQEDAVKRSFVLTAGLASLDRGRRVVSAAASQRRRALTPQRSPARCAGARSDRSAAAARRRSPACRASRTSSTSASVNGGVWKTTDYGRTWTPIFDDQPTGSIGAIAVAPSDPERHLRRQRRRAAAARPLRRRRHLQIHRRRQDLDPPRPARRPADSRTSSSTRAIPNRLFVAVLGHPYGPNAERGIFRSTDGGADVPEGALQGREHRRHPIVAVRSDESRHRLRRAVGGAAGPVGERRVDRHRRRHLQVDRRRHHLAPADRRPAAPKASSRPTSPSRRATRSRLYAVGRQSADRSASIAPTTPARHWTRDHHRHASRRAHRRRRSRRCPRSIRRIPTSSTSPAPSPTDRPTAARRGPAFRGAPGGDDYQRIWINPNNPNIILLASDQGAIITVNGGETWSSWYNQPTAQIYHVNADNAFPYRVCGGQQESGSACVASRGNDGEITFRDWHPVGVEEYGYAAPDPLEPDIVYGGKVTRFDRRTGQVAERRAQAGPARRLSARCAPRRSSSRRSIRTCCTSPRTRCGRPPTGGRSWTADQPRPDAQDLGDRPRASASIASSRHRQADAARRDLHGRAVAARHQPHLGRHRRRPDPRHRRRRHDTGRTSRRRQLEPVDEGVDHRRRPLRRAAPPTPPINTLRLDDLRPHIYRTHDGGKTWTEIVNGIPDGAPVNAVREDPKTQGPAVRRHRARGLRLASTTATTGSRCG